MQERVQELLTHLQGGRRRKYCNCLIAIFGPISISPTWRIGEPRSLSKGYVEGNKKQEK